MPVINPQGANNQLSSGFKGQDKPEAIWERDAIFRFSLTDNFDPGLSFPNI